MGLPSWAASQPSVLSVLFALTVHDQNVALTSRGHFHQVISHVSVNDKYTITRESNNHKAGSIQIYDKLMCAL